MIDCRDRWVWQDHWETLRAVSAEMVLRGNSSAEDARNWGSKKRNEDDTADSSDFSFFFFARRQSQVIPSVFFLSSSAKPKRFCRFQTEKMEVWLTSCDRNRSLFCSVCLAFAPLIGVSLYLLLISGCKWYKLAVWTVKVHVWRWGPSRLWFVPWWIMNKRHFFSKPTQD